MILDRTIVSVALARGNPQAFQVTVAPPLSSRVAQGDKFTGRFEAVARVEVRPRGSGYIAQVHFRDGREVDQGDLPFTIVQRPFKYAAESTEADVVDAKAQVAMGYALYRAGQMRRPAGPLVPSSRWEAGH
jgi:membrane fusion protein, multidrug efflux system